MELPLFGAVVTPLELTIALAELAVFTALLMLPRGLGRDRRSRLTAAREASPGDDLSNAA